MALSCSRTNERSLDEVARKRARSVATRASLTPPPLAKKRWRALARRVGIPPSTGIGIRFGDSLDPHPTALFKGRWSKRHDLGYLPTAQDSVYGSLERASTARRTEPRE